MENFNFARSPKQYRVLRSTVAVYVQLTLILTPLRLYDANRYMFRPSWP
jgi:hypothetical protein